MKGDGHRDERRPFLHMKIDTEKVKKPAAYAAAGAGVALVAAMVVPAAMLLGLGAATVGAAYLYGAARGDARGDCPVADCEKKEGGDVD